MKTLTTPIFLMLITTSLYAQDRLERVTGYGYEVGKIIEMYEDKSNGEQHHVDALVTFTHIFYSNALAVSMIRDVNNEIDVSYYCESKAKSNPIQEIELFISWIKLKANDDKTILTDAITTIYPIYLMSMYPLSSCSINN